MACLKGKPSQLLVVGTAAFVACVMVVIGVVLMTQSLGSDGSSSRSSNSNTESGLDVQPPPPTTPTTSPSDMPSSVPSNFPTQLPTSPPTASPTSPPTASPTPPLTASPTTLATASPTTSISTVVPTSAPTEPELFVEPNPVPNIPDPTYFNYDPTDSDYGPDNWGDVDTSNSYLKEFSNNGFGPWKGHLGESDPTENRCDPGDRDHQSPIDLYQTQGEDEAICDAPHQIRSRSANYGIGSHRITKRIEPHKLSLVPDRRACLDVNLSECKAFRPPVADYPRYSSGLTHFSDLLNFDIKFPGEHRLEGESFDGEIQMLHTHLASPRVSAIGVPIRATADGFNADFQDILNQFQLVYDRDMAECNAKNTTIRRRAVSTEGKYHNERRNRASLLRRELQMSNQTFGFNPYSEALMPTVYFFRYDGTFTDPPCVYLTWWVLSSPMIISFEQLRQGKDLLFTHVNGDCEKTSVHNEDQSVARPLQVQAGDQYVMKCTEDNFVADIFK